MICPCPLRKQGDNKTMGRVEERGMPKPTELLSLKIKIKPTKKSIQWMKSTDHPGYK